MHGTAAWQAAKLAERGALAQQAEALVAVAAAHADGKESYARGIATELLEDFLAVEERFAAAREATEQEVIDSLRQVRLRSCRMLAGNCDGHEEDRLERRRGCRPWVSWRV